MDIISYKIPSTRVIIMINRNMVQAIYFKISDIILSFILHIIEMLKIKAKFIIQEKRYFTVRNIK